MSRILNLVNMSQKYLRSKRVTELQLEEPPWTNLAAPCHLEESASHQCIRVKADFTQQHTTLGIPSGRERLLQMKNLTIMKIF